MRSILGVSWHSAFELREWVVNWKNSLEPKKQKKVVTQFLGFGDEELKEGALIVFVPTITVLKQHLEALDEADCVVILFGDAIIMRQANITILDAVTNDDIRFVRRDLSEPEFILKVREGLNGEHQVEMREFDLIPNLISNANGTLTEALLNLTFRCRVPEKRREITTAYVDWLMSDRPIKVLEGRLEKLGVDETSIRFVVSWLTSAVGSAARGIFTKVAELRKEKKSVNYEKLCGKSGVAPYDIRYLLGYARGARVEEMNVTSAEQFNARATRRAAQAQSEIDAELAEREGIADIGDLGIEDLSELELSAIED